MLRTDLTDHRGTDDARLIHAVADGDAIALAEAYHRTVNAAYACARRLLASPVEIEALIRSVYSDLWEEPPVDEALEGWIRTRCFALGTGYLRQRGLRAPAVSLAAWTSGIEADGHHSNDALEQMIAELSDEQQAALVRAHDQGLRTSEQDDVDAGDALQHALLVLASPLTDDERHAAEMCSSGVALADWTFGLLPPHEAATVPGTAAEPTPCGRLAGVLRRARRRFEPLPPTPDLGHRVLAWVLGNGQSRESQQTRASRLDSDLRVASAALDRGRGRGGHGVPRSSLDMTVPSSAREERDYQPVSALRPDDDAARGWEPDGRDRRQNGEQPTPRPAASGPPALAGTPAAAFGNAAPALAPRVAEPDDEASEELVRMPLTRAARPRLAPADDPASRSTIDDPTETIPPARPDDERPPPPLALRRDPGDDGRPPAAADGPRALDSGDGPAPSPLSDAPAPSPLSDAPAPSPLSDAPAPSPLSNDEQRGSLAGHDLEAESPLRRPAPAHTAPPGDRSSDTQPPSPLDRDRQPPSPLDRNLDTQPPSSGDRNLDTRPPSPLGTPEHTDRQRSDRAPGGTAATVQTPIQRDSSDPGVGDLFGEDVDTAGREPSDDRVTNMTAPTLPAPRRPTPPKQTDQPQAQNRTQTQGQQPAARPGPALAHTEPEPAKGGNSVLRWLVVLLLIAAGAAVGIMLGQALI